MRIYRFLTIGLLAFALSSCGTAMMKELAKEIKNFENRDAIANQKPPVRQPALYCYNTLGTVSCYDKPRANEDSRFVGTTVEPIDPEVNSKHIVGEISLPAPPVEESNDNTMKSDGNPVEPVATDPVKVDAASSPAVVPPAKVEKPASENKPANKDATDASVPVVPAAAAPTNSISAGEMPANKPLSPDALNPPKPVVEAVKPEDQKPAEPIVPPRKKKNVKKSPKASEKK